MDELELGHQLTAKMTDLRSDLGRYRALRGNMHPISFDGTPEVPKEHLLRGCQVLSDRVEILRSLRPGGRFAEVGTLYGDFAVKIIEIYRPSELHLLDLGFKSIRVEHQEVLSAYNSVVYHVGDSSRQMALLPDEFFDVIYIDGDHSFAGVWKDLMQAHLKIKAGGYIICNDYTNFDPLQLLPYGVYAAVNKFANSYGYKFEFLALAAMGFHDVGLRRW